MTTPRVVVLMGGPDHEHAVSLESGRAIAGALRAHGGYAVAEATIGRISAVRELESLLDAAGARSRSTVIVPALHGPWGEGGPLQEILEATGRPYVGSGPAAAALAMDKLATKALAEAHGVATPASGRVRVGEAMAIDPPLVLKPIAEGSSVHMRLCRTRGEADVVRRALEEHYDEIMAERYVAGRELTVGVVDGTALPVVEIIPAVDFYDYDAKYVRDDTEYRVAPPLDPVVHARLIDASLSLCTQIGIRDLARVDFILEDDTPWLLEVNTMPGFTSHSLLPMAAREAGMEMPELCAMLVEAAAVRGAMATT